MAVNIVTGGRIVARMELRPLSDRMADVLRTIGDIDSESSRMLAYAAAAVDHRGYSLAEISLSDKQAVSIELARRINGGHQ